MDRLSVVVPATDGPPTLDRCTAALAAALGPADELIVVDGPDELSASAARNVGAARATGDAIVFVDADVEVHPDALDRVRAALADDAEAVAVCGSYDDAPDAPGLVSRFRNLLHHHVHHQGAGPASTFWTGLGAVRRRAFEVSRGFDEARYPHPSIEDVELGHRLVAAGGRIVLDPRIQGTHLKRWTLLSMLRTDLFRRGIPWVALLARERRGSTALNLGWRHRLSATACAVTVVAVALRRPVVAGAALVSLVGLNHRFYRLLARRQGPLPAAVGVALHGAHHLAALVAVPAGLALAASTGIVGLLRARRVRPTGAPAGRTVTP